MAIFDTEIIQIEWGYSNDPDDLGRETKYGISKRSYPDVDIKNLTVEGAIEIYTRDYWDKNNLSSIHDQITANIIFRFIVDAGAPRGIRLLQNAINTFVPMIPSIRVDGVMGVRTIQSVNNLRTIRLQDCLRVFICKYYLDITIDKPEEEKYLKGWIKRALM